MAHDGSFFSTKRLRQSFWHCVRLPSISSSDVESLAPRPATEVKVEDNGSQRQMPSGNNDSTSWEIARKEPRARDAWTARGVPMRGIHVSYPKTSDFEASDRCTILIYKHLMIR